MGGSLKPPRVADVLAALKGAFETKGWHGPSVLDAIKGLTPAQARRKPAGAHHSIQEIVDHVAYWHRGAVFYIRHGRPPIRPADEWAPSRTSFAVSRKRLAASHRALLGVVRRLGDRDLDKRVQTQTAGTMSLRRVLHGVAAHDAYHAGQIGLLRVLL